MKPTTQAIALRAVSYSSDQQRASSIEDQQRNCQARAKAEGWDIVANFADAAISGSDNQRPQYRTMLLSAGRSEFDVLIVDDLSRLTRDSVEQEQTIRRLEFQGVRIISTSDGYDSQSKARKVHRAVKGMMNEIFLDDLRDKTHRGQTGQALKGRWCGGRPFGYRLKAVVDPHRRDAYDQPERIGTVLEVHPEQSKVVQEIFARFADGESCLSIARDLNARAVASPGSSWKRETRRKSGWMTSGVRVILKNPRYTGRHYWNTSTWVRDPDKPDKPKQRRARPKSEWVAGQDGRAEHLRIVSDELFERAQRRTRVLSDGDKRLKAGGKPRHRLSGLLVCATCTANYVIGDGFKYACSSYLNGRACTNHVWVRRDALENMIIGPVLEQLRNPALVGKMARELEAGYDKHIKEIEARAQAAPRELQELDARLTRLRARLESGDPDMAADEIQAAIDKAEAKRQALITDLPEAKQRARVLSMLPKAAAMYLRQIEKGLDGEPREALKARVILREMLGPIRLEPGADGSLWANYRFNSAALLKAAGTSGSGGRI